MRDEVQTRGVHSPGGARSGRARRVVRALGVVSLGLGATLACVVFWLHRDTTDVFRAVAGTLDQCRTLESRDTPEFLVRLVGLANQRGETVCTAWIRQPRQLPRDHHTLVVYSGGNTGDDILDLIPARPNLVLAAIQYPYERPRGWLAKLRLPFDVRNAAFRTVAGGLLAVDYLVEEVCVDPSSLLVLGVSLGSVFATMHVAVDARVPELAIIHGGGDFQAIGQAAIERLRKRPPFLFAAPALIWTFADTFDPVHWVGRISPRRVTVIASEEDEYFPRRSAERVFERAGEPKQLRWTQTGHVHAWKSQVVTELVALVESRLDGLPLD